MCNFVHIALPDEASQDLADDVTYRLKQLVQVSRLTLPFLPFPLPSYSLYQFLIIPRETRGYRFQLFRLSVCPGSCPGYISKSTQWKVFKFYIQIEHQWKVCNVVFSFDLMKNCENYRILKTYEILGSIRPRVQAVSPKVYNGVLLSIRIQI